MTVEAAPNLPYLFAKRNGVALVGEANGTARVALRQGADPRALIEARRVLGRPLAVEAATPEGFDKLLSERYAMDEQAAADAAGSLGLGDELSHLATDLPTADDLLDSADDAPRHPPDQRHHRRRGAAGRLRHPYRAL
jgi:general secretion pathway protein E